MKPFIIGEFEGFKTFAEIPAEVAQYVIKTADVGDITALSLEDINGLMFAYKEYDMMVRKEEWSDGWVCR